MDSFIRRRIQPICSAHQPDLAWSYRPFLYSFRILGIDLDFGQPRSKLRRIVSSIFGIIVTILPLVTGVLAWFGNIRLLNDKDAWLESITNFLIDSSQILTHLAVSIKLFKWRGLWRKVEQIESNITFPATFYTQLHKISIILTASSFMRVIRNQDSKFQKSHKFSFFFLPGGSRLLIVWTFLCDNNQRRNYAYTSIIVGFDEMALYCVLP